MRKYLLRSFPMASLCLALGLSTMASAAEIKGVLMDQACSGDFTSTGGQTKALKHERACALMEQCVKSGFGVITEDNKFLRFDDSGNQKMLAMLQNSVQKDNLKIKVAGDVDGDTIKVQSIQWEQ